jgi:hypothetical protein
MIEKIIVSRNKIMSEVTKFTEEEMQEIAQLQSKFQERIFGLGQIEVDQLSLEESKKALDERKLAIVNDLKDLRTEENGIVNKLASKYGNGSLSLRDGTFTPSESTQVDQSQTVQPVQPVVEQTQVDGNLGVGTTQNTESIATQGNVVGSCFNC